MLVAYKIIRSASFSICRQAFQIGLGCIEPSA
jgi:hypothetical protein